MQVDPMNPTLKAPGSERLTLRCDYLLSIFAFNFKLRRYNEGTKVDGARSFQFTVQAQSIKRSLLLWDGARRCDTAVRRCRLTL